MAEKTKAAQAASTRTAQGTAIIDLDNTRKTPLECWFDLAKPSRNRQQKRGWSREKK